MAYGFPEKTQIPCPFCGGPITVLWIPEAKRPIKASWGGSKTHLRRSISEEYLVQEDCPGCKKTKEEIQKVLNEEQKEKHRIPPSITKYSIRTGRKK
ncbi:MAG: hypothetical protein QXQ18_02885 [Candidatus Aenigmatarchaeota archaeon]